MDSGNLDKRLELQNAGRTRNQAGEKTLGTWTTFSTVWASIRPAGAKEMLRAAEMKLVQEITHTIRIRKSTATADLTSETRAKLGARIFEIVGIVDVMERGIDLEILAVESKT